MRVCLRGGDGVWRTRVVNKFSLPEMVRVYGSGNVVVIEEVMSVVDCLVCGVAGVYSVGLCRSCYFVERHVFEREGFKAMPVDEILKQVGWDKIKKTREAMNSG